MLTEEQKTLVKDSFSKVEPISEQAAELFYGRLFELAPEVKPLFKGDMKEQGIKLMKTLKVAVNSLDKLDTLVPIVQDLGKRHVQYGVSAEHYDTVGAALLWTLDKGLGDSFTPATKEAWAATYGLLADVMIKAAESVEN